MQLEDYLMDGETIEAKVEAYNRHDAYSDRYKGKLACTPLRVIYVNDHDVVDISLQSINSVDYTEPSLSQYQITTSVALSLLGVVGMILTPLLQSMSIIPPDLANSVAPGLVPIGLFFIGIGGYSLYRAYSQQRSELTLHTPNQSYDLSLIHI